VIGIAIPTFFYILITIITVGTLGIDNVITSPWPTLDVLRSFEITGIFFERFESFLLAVWIMQIFTTFVGTTYFAALGLSQLTQRKITPFIYGISPLVYISAMIPQNINEFFTMGQWLEFIQMFTIAIIAPLLWIVSVLRGKKA
jgi:spore germination protein